MKMRRVVFLLGLSHSGSTLLGNVLDVHPNILHIGEITTPLARNHPFRCYHCGERRCPIWGEVLSEGFLRRYYTDYLRSRHKWWRFFVPLMELFGLYSVPGDLFTKVFSHRSDIEVIIEKSMSIPWTKWNNKSSEYTSNYLLLVRDLRGVIASCYRKYPEKSVREWAITQGKIMERTLSFFDALDEAQKSTIYYEDLAEKPADTLKDLCDFLDVTYTPDFLNYAQFAHHIIGGNLKVAAQSLGDDGSDEASLLSDRNGELISSGLKYYGRRSGFWLDTRWKEELSEEDLRLIEVEVGQIQRRFGYF